MTHLHIVDDDERIRGLLAQVFDVEGYVVETAENGRHALHVMDRSDTVLATVARAAEATGPTRV